MTNEQRTELLNIADEIAEYRADDAKFFEAACDLLNDIEPKLRRIAERRTEDAEETGQ